MSKTYNNKPEKKTYFNEKGEVVRTQNKKELAAKRAIARLKKYQRRSWECKVKQTSNGIKITLKKEK